MTAFVVLFGILLPYVALAVEAVEGMSASIYVDPIPTVWHALLVAVVPTANVLGLLGTIFDWPRMRTALRWLNAMALGVALVYSLVFLPIAPAGVVGILAMGMGLLPLSPLLSLFATAWLRSALNTPAGPPVAALADLPPDARPTAAQRGSWGQLAAGVCVGVLLLAILEVPNVLTQLGVDAAQSASPALRAEGVAWLRRFSCQQQLLRMCYRAESRSLQLANLWARPIPVADAQQLYFRVTGEPFNTVPPPSRWRGPMDRGGLFDDFDFDPDIGGTAVAGRRRGLSLGSSRLDASIAADSAVAYQEWTLVFRNNSPVQREARAQIQLPPGGVVSRLTLWVNGEPREAAFAGTGQVRAAYQEVAVAQRRDPVLVTWAGVDRVLMQCFPVPPAGGEMKVRLGITAPLERTPSHAILHMPRFVERNFGIGEDPIHAAWIESNRPIQSACPSLKAEQGSQDKYVLQGTLDELTLGSPEASVHIARLPLGEVWTADLRDPKQAIVQKAVEVPATAAQPIVLVVDGSRSMAEHLADVAKVVEAYATKAELRVLLAGDNVTDIPDVAAGGMAGQFAQAAGRGGCDNVPALIRACEIAAQAPGAVVVWVHGPQPVVLDPLEPLVQRFERQPGRIRVYDLQWGVGPNRITEPVEMLKSIDVVRACGEPKEDLAGLLDRLTGQGTVVQLRRERVAAEPRPAAPQGSPHVARLWARDEVARRAQGGPGGRADAVALAASYQLVTAVSGAVVLETQEQYQRADLQPVDPDTVPVVPEPEMWLLLAVVGIVLGWELWRRGWRWRTA